MLTIRKMKNKERVRFNKLEGKYHYMGETHSGGDTLRLIVEEDGVWKALMVWGSACYRLKDRDAWIGWTPTTRAERQKLVVQNRRFTILAKKGAEPNLASKTLALSTRELPNLWYKNFGYEPLLCETFCDMEVSAGTCYSAAGWTPLGETKGFSRTRQTRDFYVPNDRPKTLWIKPLRKNAAALLRGTDLPFECLSGAKSDAWGVLPIKDAACESLHEALCRVPDPRKSNSSFHIGSILALLAMGVMAGHKDLAGIVRMSGRITQKQRKMLGLPRYKKGSEKGSTYRKTPSYSAFRNLLKQIDTDAFARVLGEWLRANEGTLPRHLAMDGKFVGTTVGVVSLADAATGVPLAMISASNKKGEGKKSELLVAQALVKELNLTNAVVSGDALHCQQDSVRGIVAAGGEALVQAKGNQSNILKNCVQISKARPFFFEPIEITVNENGRLSIRKTWVYQLFDPAEVGLVHAQTLIVTRRIITDNKTGVVSDKTVYHLSTEHHQVRSAREWAELILNHWGIESKNHGRRDNSLNEDKTRSKNSAIVGNFCIMRAVVLYFNSLTESQNINEFVEICRESKRNTLNMIMRQRKAK
jgi:predicted transposase YbfD/YdcC